MLKDIFEFGPCVTPRLSILDPYNTLDLYLSLGPGFMGLSASMPMPSDYEGVLGIGTH